MRARFAWQKLPECHQHEQDYNGNNQIEGVPYQPNPYLTRQQGAYDDCGGRRDGSSHVSHCKQVALEAVRFILRVYQLTVLPSLVLSLTIAIAASYASSARGASAFCSEIEGS